MARQIGLELYVGQKVLVYPNPTEFPREAIIERFDGLKGEVIVTLKGLTGKWEVRPRAVVSLCGRYLHHEGSRFYFDDSPFLD
jgi:hypothetical protein